MTWLSRRNRRSHRSRKEQSRNQSNSNQKNSNQKSSSLLRLRQLQRQRAALRTCGHRSEESLVFSRSRSTNYLLTQQGVTSRPELWL